MFYPILLHILRIFAFQNAFLSIFFLDRVGYFMIKFYVKAGYWGGLPEYVEFA